MPPLGVEPTPWEILGVPEGSSPAVVRTAWRRAVRESHPDHIGGGDVERFLKVNDAYRQLEETFAPLRGAHPVDVATVGYTDDGPAAGAPDPFEFLDPDPAPDAVPDPTGTVDADDDPGTSLEAAPQPDPFDVFDQAIDEALGSTPPRRWSRSARRRSAPARQDHSPAPGVDASDARGPATGPAPDPAPEPEPAGPGRFAAVVAGAEAARTALAARSGSVGTAAVAGVGSAVAFAALRLVIQATVGSVAQLPAAAVAAAGALVGVACWFVVSRLGAEPDHRAAGGLCAALVVIVAVVDILLLGAVPILLIGVVAYTATHRGPRDRARR